MTRRGAEAARQAHNLEVVGSNPAAAITEGAPSGAPFLFFYSFLKTREFQLFRPLELCFSLAPVSSRALCGPNES